MAVQSVADINERLTILQNSLTESLKNTEEFKSSLTNGLDIKRELKSCYGRALETQLNYNYTDKRCLDYADKRFIVRSSANAVNRMIYKHDLENADTELQNIKDRVTLLDGKEKEQLSSKIETIASLFEKCRINLAAFKNEIIKTIQSSPDLLVDNQGYLFGSTGPTEAHDIGVINECHCCDTMKRSPRGVFSVKLIQSILQKWPDKKEITIASIGAGGCFHELEIHALLAEKGIKTNWLIIDPSNEPIRFKQFETFANWAAPGITVTYIDSRAEDYFAGFSPIQRFAKNLILPDVFLFIDIDLYISLSDISKYQTQVEHPCLFADYNKSRAMTIEEVN